MSASVRDPKAPTAFGPVPFLIEYFRYHGVWAPGVKLLRRLQFRSKAIIISTVFCLPTLLLGWFAFADNAGALHAAQRQIAGLSLARALQPLDRLALELRRDVLLAAAKGVSIDGRGRDALVEQIKQLQAQHVGAGPLLTTALAKLGEGMAAPLAVQSLKKAIDAQAVQAAALGELMEALAAESGLAAQPGASPLANLALLKLPQLIEGVGQLHILSLAQASTGAKSAELAKALAVADMRNLLSDANFVGALEQLETAQPTLVGKLGSAAARRQVRAFQELAALGTADAARIDRAGQDAVASLFVLQGKLLAELDGLLQARVAALESGRNGAAGVALLCIAIGAYLFYAFFIVTRGGLLEVQKHLAAMTAGDLTTRPNPWGKDETASLMGALREMQAALRKIVTRVRGSSELLLHGSNEIASASLDVSARTEQTASNLQLSASSMERISGTVKSTADKVIEVAQVASANSQSALRGGGVIGQVVATMQEIHASSSKISEIIGTIDGIAFQTNILALNAAVEAARAGDHGRGFAVVAGEVRGLAQRSANAAKEIKSLITSSVESVAMGTRVVQGAGATMQEIVGNAKRVQELLADISSAASEQSLGINQVGESVADLDRATQKNAALVEETAAAAWTLKDQAVELAAEVSAFRLPA